MTTTDQVKAWLARYGSIAREIALLEARADALRTRETSPASPTLDGMPRAPGFAGDRIGGMVGAIDRIEQEVKEKRREAAVVYNEIDAALHQISGPHAAERRTVLQCRYLDGTQWTDVAFLLFGDKDDFNEREESYGRRVFNIHKAALQDLAQVLGL